MSQFLDIFVDENEDQKVPPLYPDTMSFFSR